MTYFVNINYGCMCSLEDIEENFVSQSTQIQQSWKNSDTYKVKIINVEVI